MMVSDKNFYSLLPDGYHATGDIWMNLPSFGLVTQNTVSGLVVSPACDLANSKTETITYVPIVSVANYLMMPEMRLEVATHAGDFIRGLGLDISLGQPPNFDFSREEILEKLDALKLDKKKESLRSRCRKAVEFLCGARDETITTTRARALLEDVLGNSWEKAKSKIIRNTYRTDIYYLPPDQQNPTWSAIPGHSVALLRYLLTVPTYFLDEAHRADDRDWSARRNRLIAKNLHWCNYCHDSIPPVRTMNLRSAFLGDLLTRFAGLYVRLGTPDLDPQVLQRIEKEI